MDHAGTVCRTAILADFPFTCEGFHGDFNAHNRAIVGIEVTMEALTGKWKVSQNRSAADRAGVVHGLRQEAGDQASGMAALVSEILFI